jgi:hypothetical protein
LSRRWHLYLIAGVMGTVVEQALGPVQRHDRNKGSELLRTLEVFLEQERSAAEFWWALQARKIQGPSPVPK